MKDGQMAFTEKKTNRPLVLAAVMLAMFMGAVESTIVSTALPAIVGDLGGFSLYSWVFSAYLLTNTVTVLLYGKLSDLFGRKPILSFGIILFLIGSILCGLAESMEALILFRLIQGFGAGAVAPVASTIVGDIYSLEERAKVQGYLSSVWGISAIMGPALGGFLVQYVSWRYVFWINIPLGILALTGLWFFLHEKIDKKKHDIDYKGALFLTIGISTFMILLMEGGVRWSWLSGQTIGIALVILVSMSLFVWQEKRAKEPVMPFDIWNEKTILIANLTSLSMGIILIGISSYLPAFVQGVMDKTPTVAGFTLTSMSIGWPIASTLAGRMLIKIGYRATCLIGGFSLVIGAIIFVLLTPEGGPLMAASGSFFIGVGMGLTSTSFLVSIQSTVEWRQRGIATAANMFMRNLGNTIGAALLGGILNNQLMSFVREQKGNDAGVSIDSVNKLLDASERAKLEPSVLKLLQDGLTFALHNVYIILLAIALISLVMIWMMPKKENQNAESGV